MTFVYSIEGDVWSFGVVLFEICSQGKMPYAQYRSLTEEFLGFLKGGGRPTQESHWSGVLCSVMAQCWREAPRQRPTFGQLRVTLKGEHARLAAAGASRPRAVSDIGYEMPWTQPKGGGAPGTPGHGAGQGNRPPAASRQYDVSWDTPNYDVASGAPVGAGAGSEAAYDMATTGGTEAVPDTSGVRGFTRKPSVYNGFDVDTAATDV